MDDELRFWDKVDVQGADDCWEWTAYRGDKGYGQVGHGGKLEKAHRVAYALGHTRGVIPDSSVCVLHACDNPPCCNPAHLFAGDRPANNEDMRKKGRQSVGAGHADKTRGELHGMAKLREEEAVEIRKRAWAGESGRSLAAEFGVTPGTISAIKHGRLWRHVGGPVRVPVRKVRP